MAKTLTIALCLCITKDPGRKNGFNVETMSLIRHKLWFHICAVLSHPSVQGKYVPSIKWDATAAEIQPHDLVAHFLPTAERSLIRRMGIPNSHGDYAGLTSRTPKGTISEIYVEGNYPPERIANIAFHELIHNKLDIGQENFPHDIHTLGGIAAAGNASEHSQLTQKTIDLMAANIDKPIKQYTDKL